MSRAPVSVLAAALPSCGNVSHDQNDGALRFGASLTKRNSSIKSWADSREHPRTAYRFGTPAFFVEQYLAGLALRTVNFNGTGNLEVFERAAIEEYARELLQRSAVPIAV